MKAKQTDDEAALARIQAAHDELLPQAQKLVDEFGQAQAYEIIEAVARTVCPDGSNHAPKYVITGAAKSKEKKPRLTIVPMPGGGGI
jgi:hypothetical protein